MVFTPDEISRINARARGQLQPWRAQPEPRYCGHSLVVGPLGQVLAAAGGGEDRLEAVLGRRDLLEARRTNPSLANRRL